DQVRATLQVEALAGGSVRYEHRDLTSTQPLNEVVLADVNPTLAGMDHGAALTGEGRELSPIAWLERVAQVIDSIGELAEHDRRVTSGASCVDVVAQLVKLRVAHTRHAVEVCPDLVDLILGEGQSL